MSQPYLSQISMVSFNFAPKGWAMCNGQLLAINQNAALFSLLGTFYGGNGTTNFALPNLQGCVPMHWGQGPGQPNYTIGERGGETSVTVLTTQMPQHTHQAQGVSTVANLDPPTANAWANSASNPYIPGAGNSPNTVMSTSNLTLAGGSQPHDNMPPYLVVNFVIALVGIFPSRN
jgi:microcystin-dependent protein